MDEEPRTDEELDELLAAVRAELLGKVSSELDVEAGPAEVLKASQDPDSPQVPGQDPVGDGLRRIAANMEAIRNGTKERPAWWAEWDAKLREGAE
ncbi:hypothetical protein ACIGXM_14020 [Kitasatospora sp. NPDC052896]|uniref:hypothetical protein n=1 Tax=Kitasatospora sp. NPDC052896 TaxID=3364061 RepID=UPI0037CAA74D